MSLTLADLPLDCLLEILYELPLSALLKLSSTSKTFYTFILESTGTQLWNCVDFLASQRGPSASEQNGVSGINLDHVDDVAIYNLFCKHAGPSQVRWLRLDYTRVSARVLKWFVFDPTILPRLERLSLNGCQDIYLPESHLDIVELAWKRGAKETASRRLSHLCIVGVRIGDQATFGGTLSSVSWAMARMERRRASVDTSHRRHSHAVGMPFWEESSEEEYEEDENFAHALNALSLSPHVPVVGSTASGFSTRSSSFGRIDGLGMARCATCDSSAGACTKRGVNRCPDCGIYEHLCTTKPFGVTSMVECPAVAHRCKKCGVRAVCSHCRVKRSRVGNASTGIDGESGLCESCLSTSKLGFPSTCSSRYKLMLETSFAAQHGESFGSPTFLSRFQSSSSALWL